MVVPSRLLVALQVVLLLLLGILRLLGILLLLRGILLLRGTPRGILLWDFFSLVDRLVGVEWAAAREVVLVLHLVGQACPALVLIVELPRRRLFVFCVRFVGEFPLPPRA